MHTITLQKQEPLAGDIRGFYFTKPHGLSWRAGNHAVFFVPLENYDLGGNSRPLSISSAPGDDHILVISHCPAENASAFKQKLANLQPGDTVEMTDPVGEFFLDDNVDNPLLVAAGIGIGAIRAILRDRELRGVPLNGELRYYAPDGQFVFEQELRDMDARHKEFGLQLLAHDIAELGQIKEIEQRVDRKVYMSGVYVQRTDIPDTFDTAEDHVAAREEVNLIEAAKKLVGG